MMAERQIIGDLIFVLLALGAVGTALVVLGVIVRGYKVWLSALLRAVGAVVKPRANVEEKSTVWLPCERVRFDDLLEVLELGKELEEKLKRRR